MKLAIWPSERQWIISVNGVDDTKQTQERFKEIFKPLAKTPAEYEAKEGMILFDPMLPLTHFFTLHIS